MGVREQAYSASVGGACGLCACSPSRRVHFNMQSGGTAPPPTHSARRGHNARTAQRSACRRPHPSRSGRFRSPCRTARCRRRRCAGRWARPRGHSAARRRWGRTRQSGCSLVAARRRRRLPAAETVAVCVNTTAVPACLCRRVRRVLAAQPAASAHNQPAAGPGGLTLEPAAAAAVRVVLEQRLHLVLHHAGLAGLRRRYTPNRQRQCTHCATQAICRRQPQRAPRRPQQKHQTAAARAPASSRRARASRGG